MSEKRSNYLLCWVIAHAPGNPDNPNRLRSALGRFVATRCASCGNVGDVDPSWDMDWWVSDEEWQRIVPEKYQNKTICPWCFVKFAQQKGERYKVRYTDFLGVVHESASGVEKINAGAGLEGYMKNERG